MDPGVQMGKQRPKEGLPQSHPARAASRPEHFSPHVCLLRRLSAWRPPPEDGGHVGYIEMFSYPTV